jgi:hypothetical protein
MTRLVGWHRHRGYVLALAFASAPVWAALPGCGRDPELLPAVPAAGTVTLDGKPVSKGTIHFQPEKGRPASGAIDDGRFTLTTYEEGDGAVAGKHKVAVEAIEAEAPETNKRQPRNPVDANKYLVPKKYAGTETSGVEVEVPPGGDSNLKVELVGAVGKAK